MSRRGAPPKREIIPDPQYKDKMVARLINYVMKDGKKSVAERIVYNAFTSIQDKTGEEPVTAFKTALEKIKPAYEVKSRRVGGASYQVPVEVGRVAEQRWSALVGRFSRARSERTMEARLAGEIVDALQCGAALKKKDDTHRYRRNKAFAHYRW